MQTPRKGGRSNALICSAWNKIERPQGYNSNPALHGAAWNATLAE
jgi:hypothetical protein